MKQLSDFLGSERGRGARIAEHLRIAPAYLSQMASGSRPVRADLAPQIERLSDFTVRRWHLRPTDWHRIWPELIGTEGAPPVPGAGQQPKIEYHAGTLRALADQPQGVSDAT